MVDFNMMTWHYYNPKFEFTSNLPIESSAWSGHYSFGYDLLANTKPAVFVELGTHRGNSFFSFAQAAKDLKLETELHCVDTLEGDEQAGFYGKEIFQEFNEIINKYYKNVNIVKHKALFDDAVKDFKDNSIDILHIDGLHTYEAVKHDFETWLPKVNNNHGIILLHDVCEKKDDFGVYKLWGELEEKYQTIKFEHYHGLGVIFLGEVHDFLSKKNLWPRYYKLLSDTQDYKQQLRDKDKHIQNLTAKSIKDLQTRRVLKKNLEKYRQKVIDNRNEIMMRDLVESKDIRELREQLEQLYTEVNEYRTLKRGSLWRMRNIYITMKKYIKNFFINIVRDGPALTFSRIYRRIINLIRNRQQLKKNANPYRYWLKEKNITRAQKRDLQLEMQNFKYQPLISIVMPVYNVELRWIKDAIKSVKNQIYPNWELCIADDASTSESLKKYLKKLAKDPRIKIMFRQENGNISEASNSALSLAEGEYIALMDDDDILYPHSLLQVVKVLNKDKKVDFIYSDEDKVEISGERVEPFFKPDWSPDLFMSTNYLSHLSVIRKSTIDKVGGFRKGYEGSQDYDLFLRITELTDRIEHIPDVLYSWRKIPGSTASSYSSKSYAENTSIKALGDSLHRRNMKGNISRGLFPGSFRTKYDINGMPLVSILIPTLNKYEYISRCISSILSKTTYPNFEIFIIDTGSSDKAVINYYKELSKDKRIKILEWKERFNYSSVNNFGVRYTNGEYVILLNNDTQVISPDWIEGMLEHAQRDKVGAVGVKLYYPNDLVQHAGVVLGINCGTGRGVAGHAFKNFPRNVQGFPVQKDIIRNYSAVTAACLMISKKKFLEVGGLEEKFRIAFNDVDFCLKLLEKGYYNVYTPYVELYHHESVSVGTPESSTRDNDEFAHEINLMYKRWKEKILNDRFYNKNLSLKSEDFRIAID